MASSGLVRCEPALIEMILRACNSFPDAVSLAATCKYVNAIYRLNVARIIRDVGPRGFIHFDYALIAVRAQAIVEPSFDAPEYQQPPLVGPIGDLSGRLRKPTTDEVRKALDLQHLARALTYEILVNDGSGPLDLKTVDERSVGVYLLFIFAGALAWVFYKVPREIVVDRPLRTAADRFYHTIPRGNSVTASEAAFPPVAQWLLREGEAVYGPAVSGLTSHQISGCHTPGPLNIPQTCPTRAACHAAGLATEAWNAFCSMFAFGPRPDRPVVALRSMARPVRSGERPEGSKVIRAMCYANFRPQDFAVWDRVVEGVGAVSDGPHRSSLGSGHALDHQDSSAGQPIPASSDGHVTRTFRQGLDGPATGKDAASPWSLWRMIVENREGTSDRVWATQLFDYLESHSLPSGYSWGHRRQIQRTPRA